MNCRVETTSNHNLATFIAINVSYIGIGCCPGIPFHYMQSLWNSRWRVCLLSDMYTTQRIPRMFLSLPIYGIQGIVPLLILSEREFVNFASLWALNSQWIRSVPKDLKNSFEKPSGPGALLSFEFLITCSSSSIVMWASSLSFCCSLSLGRISVSWEYFESGIGVVGKLWRGPYRRSTASPWFHPSLCGFYHLDLSVQVWNC